MQTCRSRSICAAQPHKSQLADLEHKCWFTNTIQYCLRPDDLRTILANNVFKRNRILLSVVGGGSMASSMAHRSAPWAIIDNGTLIIPLKRLVITICTPLAIE